MYCNAHLPQLQFAAGLLGYVQRQLGLPIASIAPLGKITDASSAAMRRFARDQRVSWMDFVKGQRKDDVAHDYLAPLFKRQRALSVLDLIEVMLCQTILESPNSQNCAGVIEGGSRGVIQPAYGQRADATNVASGSRSPGHRISIS